jgi:hypothetical protein
MSGFFYKGQPINVITKGTSSAIPGYNFTGTYTEYTGLRPLPFGLTNTGTTVANLCTANSPTVYTSSTTAPIPSGCKHISFVGRGGGGGGGGSGQNANVKVVAGGGRSESGGFGGPGVTSGYMYGYKIENGSATFLTITIGNGGAGGDSPPNNSAVSTPAGDPRTTKGLDGGDGGTGNATSVRVGNGTRYSTNTQPGGNGGGGATANYNGNSFNGSDGSTGTTPAPNPQAANYTNASSSGPSYPAMPGGGGGTGKGGGGGNNGDPGGAGSLQIIWLYE